MAKLRGRKRTVDAARYPSGGIKPEEETRVGELARARRAYLRDLRNPYFETELGFLHLAKMISTEQRIAGEEFAKLVNKYRLIVLAGPSGRPKISQVEPRIPGGDEIDHDPAAIRQTQDDYDEVYALVQECHGHKAMQLVYQLCVDNQMISAWWEKETLKRALNTMAKFFGVENKR